MSKRPTLTLSYLNLAPHAAAEVLQTLPTVDVAAFLDTIPARLAAPVIAEMVPFNAASYLQETSASQAASIFRALPFVDSASLLRLMEQTTRESILAELSTSMARRLRSSQKYPLDQVGAWTDASVPTLKTTDTVTDALRVMGASPVAASHVFIKSAEDQTFAGAITARDLLHSDGRAELGQLARSTVTPVSSRASLSAVAFNPGWYECLFLPVIGRRGTVLGGLSRAALARGIYAQRISGEQPASTALAQLLIALAVCVQGLLKLVVGGGESVTPREHSVGDLHVR